MHLIGLFFLGDTNEGKQFGIPNLWRTLRSNLHILNANSKNDTFIGMSINLTLNKIKYFAGIKFTKVLSTDSFSNIFIPKLRAFQFLHYGSLSTLSESYNLIYNNILPNQNLRPLYINQICRINKELFHSWIYEDDLRLLNIKFPCDSFNYRFDFEIYDNSFDFNSSKSILRINIPLDLI